MKKLDQEIVEKIKTEVKKEGCDLFDIKYYKRSGKEILEVIIDKVPGYVGFDDCGKISRVLSSFLDSESFFSESFSLEVSSPGIDRLLRNKEDFLRFKHEIIKVKLTEKIENRSVIVGILKEYLETEDKITISENDTGKLFSISISLVKEARLHPEV